MSINISVERQQHSSEYRPIVDWLWTNGVNTNGAAAKVVNVDRLGKKVCPGTLGKITAG